MKTSKLLRVGVFAGILFSLVAQYSGKVFAADERELFSSSNIDRVENGPTAATTLKIDQLSLVTYVLTYHYNGGGGMMPGTLALRHEDGTLYGPWQATGGPDPAVSPTNMYWVCRPNFVIKPGAYTVIDSHPASWSWNAKSGGGMTVIKGRPVAEAANQPVKTPIVTQAPAQTQKTAGDVLVSQEVLPSGKEQTVSWKDQVKVTVPAGLVDSKQTLTIATAQGLPPHPFKAVSPLVAFDVSLGNLHEFNKDLTIEIAYDPAKIRSDLPPEDALMAMTWDSEQKTWVMERFTVDAQRKVVIIRTNHLSAEQIAYVQPPYTVYKPKHFIFIYDPEDAGQMRLPEEKVDRRGETRTLPARTEPMPAEKLVADLGLYLDHAWEAYLNAKFKPLTGDENVNGKLWVFMDSALKVSEREKFSGNLYFPTNWVDTQYKDSADQMRQETAHELFHAVQNQYYTWVGMARRRWWMEATADYAADAIAWGGAGTMPLVPANYFKKPIDSTEARHDYKTSRFVEYLSRPSGSFKAMWDYVVPDITGDVVGILSRYLLQRDTELDKEYRGFVAYVLFDSKGPLSPTLIDAEAEKPVMDKGLLYSPAVERVDILEVDKTTLSYSFPPIEKLTASVWGIRVKAQDGQKRRLKIENTDYISDLPDEKLDVYVLKNDVRPDGGVKPEGTLRKSSPTLNLRPLDNDDIVYLVGTNGRTGTRPLPVKVTDASLIISPSKTSVDVGESVTFTTPGVTEKVLWTVQEGASGGTLDAAGGYTAPDKAGTYHVVATLDSDRTVTATATVETAASVVQDAGEYLGKWVLDKVTKEELKDFWNPTYFPVHNSTLSESNASTQFTYLDHGYDGRGGTFPNEELHNKFKYSWSKPKQEIYVYASQGMIKDPKALVKIKGRVENAGTTFEPAGYRDMKYAPFKHTDAALSIFLPNDYVVKEKTGESSASILWDRDPSLSKSVGSFSYEVVFGAPYIADANAPAPTMEITVSLGCLSGTWAQVHYIYTWTTDIKAPAKVVSPTAVTEKTS